MATKVYKVYDDEWEDIMGDKQIREFAINQLCDKADNLIEEAKDGYGDKKLADKIKVLWDKVQDNYENLTMEEVETVFKAFDFDYEELNVR